MVTELLMGFDEQNIAYDLQRAHSADIWFMRARFYIWGGIACVSSFLVGHALSFFGVNLYAGFWHLLTTLWSGTH